IAGMFLTNLLSQIFQTHQILVLVIMLFGGWAWWTERTFRRFQEQLQDALRAKPKTRQANAETPPVQSWYSRVKEPYYRYLYALGFVSIIILLVVDYSFLNQVKSFFSAADYQGMSLAAFYANLFGAIGILQFLFKTVWASRFIRRYRVGAALNLTPWLLLMLGVLQVSLLIFIPNNPGLFLLIFLLAVAAKFVDQVLRLGMYNATFELFYQTIPKGIRPGIQAAVGGIVSQLGIVLIGVLYFVGVRAIPEAYQLHLTAGLLVVGCLLWIYFARQLYEAYKNKLAMMLNGKSADTDLSASTPGAEVEGVVALPSLEESAPKMSSATEAYDRFFEQFCLQQYQDIVHQLAKHQSTLLSSEEELRHQLQGVVQGKTAGSEEFATKMAEGIAACYRTLSKVEDRRLALRLHSQLAQAQSESFLRLRATDKIMSEEREYCFRMLEAVPGRDFPSLDRHEVWLELNPLLEYLTWIAACRADLQASLVLTDPLLLALEAEKEQTLRRIFIWLRYLYDPEAVQLIQEYYFKEEGGDTSILMMELLENLLSQEDKAVIFPFFETVSPAQLVKRQQQHFPQDQLAVPDRLMDMVMKDFRLVSSWTKVLALEALLQRTDHQVHQVLGVLLLHPDPLLYQTAAVLTYVLSPQQYHQWQQDLAPAKQEELSFVGEASGMDYLLLRDTIALLKMNRIFKEWEPRSLVALATRVDMATWEPGERLTSLEQAPDENPGLWLVVAGGLLITDEQGSTYVLDTEEALAPGILPGGRVVRAEAQGETRTFFLPLAALWQNLVPDDERLLTLKQDLSALLNQPTRAAQAS
ncbi:MAG: hypothetical protein AAFQ98_11605, partial [Bacteroidota bacterium]